MILLSALEAVHKMSDNEVVKKIVTNAMSDFNGVHKDG